MNNQQIIKETQLWFKKGLGCMAGKLEFAKERYMFCVVSDKSDIEVSFSHFINQLQNKKISVCLFICDNQEIISQKSVEPVIRYLSQLFAPINGCKSEDILKWWCF